MQAMAIVRRVCFSNTAHFNVLLDTPVGIQPLQPLKHQTLSPEDYICKMPDGSGTNPVKDEDVSMENVAVNGISTGGTAVPSTGASLISYGLRPDGYMKRSARGVS